MGERGGHVRAMSADKCGQNLRFVVGDALTPCLLVPEKKNVSILLSRVNFIFEKTQMLCVSNSQCTDMNESSEYKPKS